MKRGSRRAVPLVSLVTSQRLGTNQLDQLMQRAVEDKAAEPEFFRVLLDATVYAHAPRTDDRGRLRFIMFPRPDGLTVLPFFSDRAQADAAAGNAAIVVALTGRQLFELTRGAILMLNPNGTNCTLYPEEITALLDRGEVAIIEKVDTGAQDLSIGQPDQVPLGLIAELVTVYVGLASVEAAYLLEIHTPNNPERRVLLVALAIAHKDAERAARATSTALQSRCQALQMEIDVTAFDPSSPPDWMKDTEVDPFYTRSLGERLVAATDKLQ